VPFYCELDDLGKTERRRVAENLLLLRKLLNEGKGLPGDEGYIAPIPPRSLDDNIIVATWNIREFDSSSYGFRGVEPMMYIAEIIARFDIVAIQEVRLDTKILKDLQHYLGDHWGFVVTDETAGTSGNDERLAIFYDTRKVQFTGVVGEVVLPPVAGQPVRQFARSPLLVGFQCGWFKFSLCTAHIIYGTAKADDARRVKEIQQLASYLKERMSEYQRLVHKGKISSSEYENIILLGDFNIFSTADETYRALISNGWDVSEGLFGTKTNTGAKKRSFDQIAWRNDARNVLATGRAGVFDFFEVVYNKNDRQAYKSQLQKMATYAKHRQERKRQSYYQTYWRTFQMSDHLPLWIELRINFSGEYLSRRVPAPGNSPQAGNNS
jgi:endonuclease/exonuclease/phosphatase family metal-dependent hydrolase